MTFTRDNPRFRSPEFAGPGESELDRKLSKAVADSADRVGKKLAAAIQARLAPPVRRGKVKRNA